jgi:transposase InsO family protein
VKSVSLKWGCHAESYWARSAAFCLDALDEALACGRPSIFNSDQGAQFTSQEFTERLKAHGVAISMDGRGRALDNAFIERFWRSLKYEEIYLKEYANVDELYSGLSNYFDFYATQRPHQGLNNRTPYEVYTRSLTHANSQLRQVVLSRPATQCWQCQRPRGVAYSRPPVVQYLGSTSRHQVASLC